MKFIFIKMRQFQKFSKTLEKSRRDLKIASFIS